MPPVGEHRCKGVHTFSSGPLALPYSGSDMSCPSGSSDAWKPRWYSPSSRTCRQRH